MELRKVLGGLGLYDISDHIKLIAFHIVQDGHNKNLKPGSDCMKSLSGYVLYALNLSTAV